MALIENVISNMRSIRSRLMLLVILCLVPVALVLIHASFENRRITSEQAVGKLATIVELIHSDFDDATYASSQLLTSLALTPNNWITASAQCNQQLANLSKQFASYSNIFTVNTDGEVICSATGYDAPVSLLDRDYIQSALAGNNITVGQPVAGKVSDQMVLPIALPLYEPSGEVVGAVGVSINLVQFLEHNLQSHGITARNFGNVTSTLWQVDGTVLARAPDAMALTGQQARDSELFQALIKNIENRQTIEVRGLDNERRWYAFAQIGRGDARLLLSVGLPTRELFAEVDAIFWRTMTVLALVSLLVIIAAWFIGEVAVRRPVSRLVKLAEEVSSGQRGVRVGEIHGASELKTLAKNFDLMVSYLESYEQEQATNQQALTQAKQSLELKVHERTMALESASSEAIERATLLEKQRLEIAIMNELTDMLQSCNTLDESWPIIGRSLTQLFEDINGTIYTYRDSGNALMHGVSWGDKVRNNEGFAPEDCWALRLGRTWTYQPEALHPHCNHISGTEYGPYTCIPMLADGKTLGVLHIKLPEDQDTEIVLI